MLASARAFMQACDAKDIHYREPKDLESGRTLVKLGVTGSAGNEYEVQFVFDTDDEGVGIRVYGLVRANKDTYAKMLLTCNQLNAKYRWMKFIIDSDMDVNMEADCVIDMMSVGDVCTEMFYRVMSIAKDVYPVLMKAQWS